MNGCIFLLACAAGAGLSVASGASADPMGSVFGGVVAGDVRTAYIGASMPIPAAGGRLGAGPAVRVTLGGGRYHYDATPGRIRGRDVRADASLLWQFSDANNYVDAGIGARYVDTHLSPRDPGNRREGGRWEAVASFSGLHNYDPWRVSEFGSYGFRDHDYFIRGDVSHAVAEHVFLGLEAQFDGARDYTRRGAGAVATFAPSSRWEVKLSGGVTRQNHRSGGYGGIAFRATL